MNVRMHGRRSERYAPCAALHDPCWSGAWSSTMMSTRSYGPLRSAISPKSSTSRSKKKLDPLMRLRRTLLFGARRSRFSPGFLRRPLPTGSTCSSGSANFRGLRTPVRSRRRMMSVVLFASWGRRRTSTTRTPAAVHALRIPINKFFTGFAHGALSGGCPRAGRALLTMATTGPLTVDYRSTARRTDEKASGPSVLGQVRRPCRFHGAYSPRGTPFRKAQGIWLLLNLGEGFTNESGAMVRRVSATEIEGSEVAGDVLP